MSTSNNARPFRTIRTARYARHSPLGRSLSAGNPPPFSDENPLLEIDLAPAAGLVSLDDMVGLLNLEAGSSRRTLEMTRRWVLIPLYSLM
jgi:hypothetical protein